jgi:hypothetical protein
MNFLIAKPTGYNTKMQQNYNSNLIFSLQPELK